MDSSETEEGMVRLYHERPNLCVRYANGFVHTEGPTDINWNQPYLPRAILGLLERPLEVG